MNCPSCQFENAEETKSCAQCGASLNLACPDCGSDNPSDLKVCAQCGAETSSPWAFVATAQTMLTQPDAREQLAQIEAALEKADHYIKEKGEETVRPQVTELRARIAQMLGDDIKETQLFLKAVQQYQSIGATGHVKRLTAETALS